MVTLGDAWWRWVMVKYLMITLRAHGDRGIEVKCTDCGSRNLEEDFVRGERSCLDCGLVLAENIIDPGKDWTDFDGDTDKARAGPPVMWHDKGLSTDIHWRTLTSLGKSQATVVSYSVCVSGRSGQGVFFL